MTPSLTVTTALAHSLKLEKRVWLSVGSDEWPEFFEDNQAFFREFRAAGYRGIMLETHIIKGERHAGNKPEAYNRALRFVFAPRREVSVALPRRCPGALGPIDRCSLDVDV